MSDPNIYAAKGPRSHVDHLYQIIDLAKIGAAATDTALNIDNLPEAQCAQFDMIHRLALEALDCAERAGREGDP